MDSMALCRRFGGSATIEYSTIWISGVDYVVLNEVNIYFVIINTNDVIYG